MISIILLFTVLVFNLVLKEREGRALVCFIAIIPTASHYLLFNDVDAFEYYGTAAVASSITIGLLEFAPRSPLAFHIQVIHYALIVVNFIGWVMWASYAEPFIYDVLIMALVFCEWLRLLIRTKADGEHGASHFMRSIHLNVAIDRNGDTK